MQRTLLDTLCCPACQEQALLVTHAEEHVIEYAQGPVTEIEKGTVACENCNAFFSIEAYVLSFADRLSESVRADGAYWGEFYSRLYSHGITGFLDTHCPPAPFLGMGIAQTLPFDGKEWGGIHENLASHPWVRPGGVVVDVGTGSGWSSLFLARRGFSVISFDPALELMQLAKQYAMSQGVYIEYVCTDMANFCMRQESVDAVFALHSLHHVPDLYDGLARIHRMLKTGGCLALDDHLQEIPLLSLLRDALLQEAEESVFAALRDPALELVPRTEHSENEGVGMGQLLPAIKEWLYIDNVHYRHIALDFVGPIYYLQQGCDPAALQTATQVVDLIKKAMARAWPDMVEYVTLVAQKRATLPTAEEQSMAQDIPVNPFGFLQQHVLNQEQELRRLNEIIATKNAHIQRIEQLLSRIEQGRIMRLLRRLGT